MAQHLRTITLDGNESYVHHFEPGNNIRFVPQRGGTLRIDADPGGTIDLGGDCVEHMIDWDETTNSLYQTDDSATVVGRLPIKFSKLRVESGTTFFEVNTVLGAVSMSDDMKTAFLNALGIQNTGG